MMSEDPRWLIPDKNVNYPIPAEGTFNTKTGLGILGVAELRAAFAVNADSEPVFLMQLSVVGETTVEGESIPPYVLPALMMPVEMAEGLLDTLQKALEGHLDAMPVEAQNCPGCGRKLFGDLRFRGGCLDCFPDVDESTFDKFVNESEDDE